MPKLNYTILFCYPIYNIVLVIWHNCSLKQDSDKLEKLDKRTLRAGCDDYHSTYDELLKKAGRTTLFLQNIAIMTYKSVNNIAPQYVTELVKPKISRYELRNDNKLEVPAVNPTKHGLNSFRALIGS